METAPGPRGGPGAVVVALGRTRLTSSRVPRKVQTLTLPSTIAAFSASSSALVSAGIWLSKSWNGARSTPLLASVPE